MVTRYPVEYTHSGSDVPSVPSIWKIYVHLRDIVSADILNLKFPSTFLRLACLDTKMSLCPKNALTTTFYLDRFLLVEILCMVEVIIKMLHIILIVPEKS